jgi:acetylornithine/N-succinyldiaminopimelate aminotransferase
MIAASGKAGWDELFPPVVPGFRKAPYGDINAIAQAINPQKVAVMIEPIQGEAGVIVPPTGYLQALRALTQQAGILLILDEVQTGMGRTGKLFAFQHARSNDARQRLGRRCTNLSSTGERISPHVSRMVTRVVHTTAIL